MIASNYIVAGTLAYFLANKTQVTGPTLILGMVVGLFFFIAFITFSRAIKTKGIASAVTIGRRYHFDCDHAMLVSKLSLRLFDQLRSLHGLGAADRRILHAAALLHDIGQFVSFKGHHKHSLYLISHTELPGFSQSEMQMVANVARYHRKAHPAEHHTSFMELDESEQVRVTRLASLLRVADALDREHVQRVTDLTAKLGDDELVLWLDGTAGLLMERWSLKKKANLFHKLFGRKLKLRFLGEENEGGEP